MRGFAHSSFGRAAIFTIATLTSLLASPSAHGQSGWAMGVDQHGSIFFCDIQRDVVWRYDPNSGLTKMLDHNHCHTLVLGYDGQIYGENVGGESRGGNMVGVWRMSPQGERTFLQPPSSDPNLTIWLVRDAAGNSYAWNGNSRAREVSQIIKHTPQGQTSVLTGGFWGFADGPAGQARFGEVAGFASAPDGTLFLVDDGNLRHISTDGYVQTLARGIASLSPGGFPGIGGLFNHHVGVAVDARGAVFVVDFHLARIMRWDASHGARILAESRGWANWLTRGGWGWRPTGVAALGDSVYVMEDLPQPTFSANLFGNPRIREIRPDGHSVTVVAVSSSGARMLAGLALVVLLLIFMAWRRQRPGLSAG